ncbi:MAG: UDP-N-acetylmuramoyl-tripeptide--D-alanyl-D-alanine ligase [Elusimicrobia bacterium]|nr:UDP-N-acetylmuramoyl-tripeptide--D-alanyl-D-alanine ligase [Elusimicrobiota bacterium]
MKLNLTWGALARVCGGVLTRGAAQAPCDCISTDTRRLKPEEAFWALRGARTDGHGFLPAARKAAGWIVWREAPLPSDLPPHVLAVPDTLKALQALAAFHRRRFDIPVAAITGSNGKTTTKDMLRAICARQGRTCATTGNLNNQFGLPLSILELLPEDRFGVFELGASRAGEIDALTRIADPTVAVLTNIGPAHLEFFGSLEGVFKAKTEILAAAGPQTRFAINIDDARLANLEAALGPRALTYGASERAVVRLTREIGSANTSFTLVIQRRQVPLQLAVASRIHRLNALAAAAGAVGMGLGPSDIAQGLEAFRPSPLRFELRPHASGAAFVVDAYNANPASMKAGIESFCEAYPKSKRILVLGDMKELGADSGSLHRELGEWIAAQNVSAVFLAGQDMRHAFEAIQKSSKRIETIHGGDWKVWLRALKERLSPDAAVYFKASRAMAFEELVAKL